MLLQTIKNIFTSVSLYAYFTYMYMKYIVCFIHGCGIFFLVCVQPLITSTQGTSDNMLACWVGSLRCI